MRDLVAAFRIVHLKLDAPSKAEQDAALALIYEECGRPSSALSSFRDDVVEEAASKAFIELWQQEPVDAAHDCVDERRVRAFIRRRVRLRCLDLVRKQRRLGEQPGSNEEAPGEFGTLEAGPEDAVWTPAAGEEAWWTEEEWDEASRMLRERIVPEVIAAARRKDARERLERCLPELLALHDGSLERETLIERLAAAEPSAARKALSDRVAQQHRRTRQDLLARVEEMASEGGLDAVQTALVRLQVEELAER